MEWSRLKWLLICLFFVLNIFLGVNILNRYNKEHKISQKLKQDVIAILKENNVTVDEKLIGDNRVSVRGKLIELKAGTNSLTEVSVRQDINSNITHFNDKKAILNMIKEIINEHIKNETKFIEEKAVYDPQGEIWEIDFGQYIGSYPIAGAKLHVTASPSGGVEISGSCVCGSLYDYGEISLCDPLNALLSFSVVSGSQKAGREVVIDKIELLYIISKKDTSDVLLPVWALYSDGKPACFDALSGEFIKMADS